MKINVGGVWKSPATITASIPVMCGSCNSKGCQGSCTSGCQGGCKNSACLQWCNASCKGGCYSMSATNSPAQSGNPASSGSQIGETVQTGTTTQTVKVPPRINVGGGGKMLPPFNKMWAVLGKL